MKKIISLLLIYSLPSIANDYRTFPLKPGSTISNLLYDELKIGTIYNDPYYLQKVLEFNSVTPEKARVLRPGFEVKVPLSILGKEMPSKIVEMPQNNAINPITEEDSPAVLVAESLPWLLNLGLVFYQFSGESTENQSEFSSTLVLPNIGIAKRFIKNQLTWDGSLNLGFGQIQGTEKKLPFQTGILKGMVGYQHSIGTFFATGGLKRDFYIYTSSETQEELLQAVTPFVGFRFENYFQKIQAGFEVFQHFGASNSGEKITANNSYLVDFSYFPETWKNQGIMARLQHDTKDLKSYDQTANSLYLGYILKL